MKTQCWHFKPIDKSFNTHKEFEKAYCDFFFGDLSEDFITYVAKEAAHAFWINYSGREKKISKEKFNQKFKEIVNQMLRDL